MFPRPIWSYSEDELKAMRAEYRASNDKARLRAVNWEFAGIVLGISERTFPDALRDRPDGLPWDD